jgi:xylulose-5-phosphate/fructose-6-phosphate phosphoketolase
MTVVNDIDRFHLVSDVIARVPGLATSSDGIRADAYCRAKLVEHHAYIRAHGDDMPEVRDWRWPA